MLTKQGYRVEAYDGYSFEEEILGGSNHGKLITKTEDRFYDFSSAIREVMTGNRGGYPDTWVAKRLFDLVQRRLKRARIPGELYFLKAIGTPADAFYQTDAVFCLMHGGEIIVVTIDLFYLRNRDAIEVIESHAESLGDLRFQSIGNDLPILMGMARNFLIRNYSDFQSCLYERKVKVMEERAQKKKRSLGPLSPKNHIILTPFDVERGGGLKALAREISRSLTEQIRGKPT